MTIEKLYNAIKTWRDSCNAEELTNTAFEMNKVMEQLEADMRLAEAKKSGTKSIVTAANRIIKNAQTRKKPILEGMFTNQNKGGSTLYCVCDGYAAVRFKDRPLLPEIDSKYHGQEMNLDGIVKKPDGGKEIDLPDIGELKVYIKTHKIKKTKTTKTGFEPYLLNKEIGLWVNPQYLLNVMECLPGCKAYATNAVSGVYMEGKNGDGLVLPVRKNK